MQEHVKTACYGKEYHSRLTKIKKNTITDLSIHVVSSSDDAEKGKNSEILKNTSVLEPAAFLV